MTKIFLRWKYIRYFVCSLVAFWGFMLIFKDGVDSGGKILIFIAIIGASTTFLIDKYQNSKKY